MLTRRILSAPTVVGSIGKRDEDGRVSDYAPKGMYTSSRTKVLFEIKGSDFRFTLPLDANA